MAFCDGDDTNVVTVTLSAARRSQISQILDRRGFISQTSCGLCGKELVSDLIQKITPLQDGCRLDRNRVFERLDSLRDIQPLRKKTRAAHAAAIYDAHYNLLSVAEDVGRHNAVDKAIGEVFLQSKLDVAAFMVMSSRISYELVQKASRARIPILAAISRPTALAVELASHLNMTLACMAEGDGLYIFCGQERLN
jgi:FdhD protein